MEGDIRNDSCLLGPASSVRLRNDGPHPDRNIEDRRRDDEVAGAIASWFGEPDEARCWSPPRTHALWKT